MPKLPTVSGREVVRALERLGFVLVSQRGSHIKLRRGSVICIVPDHKDIKRLTLGGILRQSEMTADDFLKALGQ